MKVLLCHNYYQQRGGEDQVFEEEAALLADSGHEVVRYTTHNDEVMRHGRLGAARRTVFNRQARAELTDLIARERPAVMHCTNTFPMISPAAYSAARRMRVPVVQSLHNFRLLCPNALLLRDGRVCEDCLGRLLAWPGILHGCYRESRSATAVVATMLARHHLAGTWRNQVDCYIALSEFARRKFIAGGLPGEKLVVKPNFVSPDPGVGDGAGGYALFVGRLSEEKGVRVLLDAWQTLGGELPLRIAGDGPLGGLVAEAANRDPSIRWLGRQPHDEVLRLAGGARCVVVPSLCYENFPKAVVEAFAVGRPVVAARIGSLPELVEHERTGLLFASGDAIDLTCQVRRIARDAELAAVLGRNARQEFLAKYTAQRNCGLLMEIYQRVLA